MVNGNAALTERLKAESEAWGLRIKIAPNLTVARSRLGLSSPDVMLIDLSFPGTEEDGLALLRELTELTPQLPVIVFAGRDTLVGRLGVSRLGAKQFLHKPATTEEIFRAISRVLAKTQSLQAKVLIVDDDAAVLAHLSALLKPWGLEVITLTEPQRFWEMLVTTSPSLVIANKSIVIYDMTWEALSPSPFTFTLSGFTRIGPTTQLSIPLLNAFGIAFLRIL